VWIPLICLISPIATYFVSVYSPEFLGYTFGYELLLVNGGFTFLGLWSISRQNNEHERR
jgi:hypothetical protein